MVSSLTRACLSTIMALGCSSATYCAPNDINKGIPVQKQQGDLSLNYQIVKMPKNEKDMGLIGIHYLTHINDYLSAGVGILGGLTGQQGGLFTLGIEANAKLPLTNHLYTDFNVYFGGGGGQGNLVKSGMLLNYNLGLGYRFNNNSTIGLSYADLNFINGQIKSQQFMVTLGVPYEFRYSPLEFLGKTINYKQLNFIDTTPYPSQVYVNFVSHSTLFNNSFKKTNGTTITNALQYIGLEYGQYINDHFFLFAQTEAMLKGLRGGYMQVIGGAGFDKKMNNKFHLLSKMAVGAGGGGGVDTGGGVLLYPELTAEMYLSKNLAIDVSAGYMFGPDGDYDTPMAGLSLKYMAESGLKNKEINADDLVYLQGLRISASNQTYPKAKRFNNLESMSLIQVQIDFLLNNHLYLTGQTDFAYMGNAGSYGEGLIGFGVQTPLTLSKKVQLFAQVITGASGGGGIDTKDGLLIKPTAGALISISEQLSLKASLGEVYSIYGKWHSHAFELGLNYQFSSLINR